MDARSLGVLCRVSISISSHLPGKYNSPSVFIPLCNRKAGYRSDFSIGFFELSVMLLVMESSPDSLKEIQREEFDEAISRMRCFRFPRCSYLS
jgi:hypothetical protein